ncbi:MAG: 50S ribosomal protein L21 [Anaerolineae bacterium]|nr:50S ribosomal protein L21 [Anaerolineae bacterium]
MKYAIIESGGKQYKAVEGATIEVDRLPEEIGKKIEIKSVLLVSDGNNITVGTPTVSGATVKTTIVDQFKGPKILVFKYHPRKRYRLKRGHRQQYTRLQIDSIQTKAAAKPTDEAPAKPAAKPAAAAPPEKKPAAKKAAAPAEKKPAAKKTTKKTDDKK